MHRQRFPARGPRGEAVVIIRTGDREIRQDQRGGIDLTGEAFWLGTGERLTPTDDARVFQASDGRLFTLL